MTCRRCWQTGHSARTCSTRPDATVRCDVLTDHAEVILRERLRPLMRPSVAAPNMLETLMLSCYLQGALDGQRPEVIRLITAPSDGHTAL